MMDDDAVIAVTRTPPYGEPCCAVRFDELNEDVRALIRKGQAADVLAEAVAAEERSHDCKRGESPCIACWVDYALAKYRGAASQ